MALAGTQKVGRVSADEQALAGYSAESSRAERQWEDKFREIPSPENQREYMTWLSKTLKRVSLTYLIFFEFL